MDARLLPILHRRIPLPRPHHLQRLSSITGTIYGCARIHSVRHTLVLYGLEEICGRGPNTRRLHGHSLPLGEHTRSVRLSSGPRYTSCNSLHTALPYLRRRNTSETKEPDFLYAGGHFPSNKRGMANVPDIRLHRRLRVGLPPTRIGQAKTPLFILVSYTLLKEAASWTTAPPCLLSPTRGMGGEVLGEAPRAHQAGGTHPTLFESTREALRSRSKVNPQWGAAEHSVLQG